MACLPLRVVLYKIMLDQNLHGVFYFRIFSLFWWTCFYHRLLFARLSWYYWFLEPVCKHVYIGIYNLLLRWLRTLLLALEAEVLKILLVHLVLLWKQHMPTLAIVVCHVACRFWLLIGLFKWSFFILVGLHFQRTHFTILVHLHLAILSALLLYDHLELLPTHLCIPHTSVRLALPLTWRRLALLLISFQLVLRPLFDWLLLLFLSLLLKAVFSLTLILFLVLEFLGKLIKLICLFCFLVLFFCSILPLFFYFHVQDLIQLADIVIIIS